MFGILRFVGSLFGNSGNTIDAKESPATAKNSEPVELKVKKTIDFTQLELSEIANSAKDLEGKTIRISFAGGRQGIGSPEEVEGKCNHIFVQPIQDGKNELFVIKLGFNQPETDPEFRTPPYTLAAGKGDKDKVLKGIGAISFLSGRLLKAEILG